MSIKNLADPSQARDGYMIVTNIFFASDRSTCVGLRRPVSI